MGEFRIAKGKVLGIQGFKESLTEKNVTDEKAIAFLRQAQKNGVNPNKLIPRFESYPSNWLALVHGSEAPAVETPKVETKQAVTQPEVVDDNAAQAEAETREMLGAFSKKQLRAKCEELSLDEAEWGKMNVNALIDYLVKQ